MKDLITFCPDLDALRAELITFGTVNEQGQPVLPVIKTPVQYSVDGKKSLSLIRFPDESRIAELTALTTLEVLGTYDEVFADPEKMAKYSSVYNIDPVTITDENGEEVVYQPPEKFGVFA